MSKKIITRRDIAERTGVSVSVVSRALNNSGYVETSKKNQILKIAEELGYYPHPVAMSLQKRRTRQILFFCEDLTNSFNIELYQGMVSAAQRRGYMVVMNGNMDFESIKDTMVDGIIMPNENATAYYLNTNGKNYHLPIVTNAYGSSAHFKKSVPLVEIDMYRVMEVAMTYLKKMGHRKIVLASPYSFQDSNARTQAFKELMTPQYGEEIKRYYISSNLREAERDSDILALIQEQRLARDGFGGQDYFLHGQIAAVLFHKRKIQATAVICFNDDFAVGFCKQIERLGMRVPEDVSVMGIDGSYIRRYVNPFLTSIAIYPHSQGECCVDVLVDIIEGKKTKYVTRLPVKVIEGETVVAVQS